MNNKHIKFITTTLSLMLIVLFSAMASETDKGLSPQELFKLHTVIETAPAPNKQYIAYTLLVPRPFDHEPGGDYRELHLLNIKNGEIKKLITGQQVVFSIGWTPDSKAVTFRANRPDANGVQLYSIGVNDKEAKLVFEHDNSIRQYEFVNNNTLVFTALDPIPEDTKQFKAKGFDIDIYEEEWRHINLYIRDLNNNNTKQLTENVSVFDFALSHDGKKAAAAIAPRNLVDDSYMFKRIHTIDLETGTSNLILENPGKLGTLAWSPDGKKLAFRSASKVEDAVVGSLFVIDVPNNKKFENLRNYAEGLEMSVIDVAWKDNNTLIFAAEEGVDIVLSEQKLNDETRTMLTKPGDVVFSSFKHTNGLISFAGNSPQHPSELFTFDLKKKKLERKTHHNKQLNDIKLAKQRKFEYKARDGMRIEGVLLYPINYTQGKSYPLITYIHGGPEAAVQNGWTTGYSTWGQVAAARDYFVFMPNYRASSGRGVDFTMVGFGDLVGTEYDDVIDGIDHLIEIGYADAEKIGIGGGSYGGYFAAWSATKHTQRFAASVVFVGIGNQVSKRNTTDIPYEDYLVHWGFWTHENYEKVYDASPVKYAHQSKTPTLVLHGSEDPRVHPSQGLEIYRSLKMHGEAPVRMVWYNKEGHGNRINLNRYDYLLRTMEWFDYYLTSDKPKDKKPSKYLEYGF